MENIIWKKKTNIIITALVIYTVASIAGDILETVGDLISGGGLLWAIMSAFSESSLSVFDVIEYLIQFLVIGGYLLLLSSLKDFSKLQKNDEDENSVMRVRKGYIFMVIAAFVGFIPLVGKFVALVFYILAYVRFIQGYKRLGMSDYIPDMAGQGFAVLKSCVVWILVGRVFSILPVIGVIIDTVINLVVFFVMLSKWRQIGDNGPEISGNYGIRIQEYLRTKGGTVSSGTSIAQRRDEVKKITWVFLVLYALFFVNSILSLLLSVTAQNNSDSYEFISILLNVSFYILNVYGIIAFGYLILKVLSDGIAKIGCALLVLRHILVILLVVLRMSVYSDEVYQTCGVLLKYVPSIFIIAGFICIAVRGRLSKLVRMMLAFDAVLSLILMVTNLNLGYYLIFAKDIVAIAIFLWSLKKDNIEKVASVEDAPNEEDDILAETFIPTVEVQRYRDSETTDTEENLNGLKLRARSFDASRLEDIVSNEDGIYNQELIKVCKRELEIRGASEQFREEVSHYDDDKLDAVLFFPSEFSEELVFCCQQEKDKRDALKLEEEARKEEERLRIEAERMKERREKMLAWWKKWRVYVIAACVLIVALLINKGVNKSIIKKYSEYYDEIVVDKGNDIDLNSLNIETIDSICDRVINKPFIAKKHKGNAYHLKSYITDNKVCMQPDSALLEKAMKMKSPLAAAEVAMIKLFGNNGASAPEDKEWAIKKLEDLNTLQADILLAAYEFEKSNYNEAYEILSERLDPSVKRFGKDKTNLLYYDETDRLVSLGYRMLGIFHYYGMGGAYQSLADARYFLDFEHVASHYKQGKINTFIPKDSCLYFNKINSAFYHVMGDLVLSLTYERDNIYYTYYTYNTYTNYKEQIYPLIKLVHRYYSSSNRLSPGDEVLNEKLKIIETVCNRSKKSNWNRYNISERVGKCYYKNGWGMDVCFLYDSKQTTIHIGQMSVNFVGWWGDTVKPRLKGKCIVMTENLSNDTYKVEVKKF